MNKDIIEHSALTQVLESRFTSKEFEKGASVDGLSYDLILKSANLAPTSFGLQPFKIIEISDQATKQALLPICFNQPQIVNCEKLLIWATELDLKTAIDKYSTRIVESKRQDNQGAEKLGSIISGFLSNVIDQEAWSAKQAYISLGFSIYSSALLGVQSTPMEGFDQQALNKLLNFKELGLSACVILALGVGDKDDKNKNTPKVRKTKEELIINLKI